MATVDRSTLDLLRGSRIIAYAVGALCLIAGLVLLFWPDRTTVVVARIVGILFLVLGFGQVAEAVTTHRRGSYWGLLLLRGLIHLGFGAALLFWPDVTVKVVVWLIGLDLVLTAALGLVAAFQVPKELGRSSLLWGSLVTAVLGIVLMAWPSATIAVVAFLAGAVLVLFGLVLLVSGYQLSRARVTPA